MPDESTLALPGSDGAVASTAGGSDLPRLDPGDRLAGRFAVVRFIAQGGMGAVYEAEDLLLRSRVALKLIRGRIATDTPAVERFRREVLLARRVSHPNVCRVYELYEARSAAGVPIHFLTMELLEGETLSRRIAREGPLSTQEALPLVRQMCEGLAAAHTEDIIHRDFKSSNVLLVPRRGPSSGDSGSGTRAVITDFGIAHAVSAEGSAGRGDGRLTGGAALLGTPAYMAPEQVTGRPVTAASDVYALGVVLYEMVTGKLPFAGDTPLASAAQRLQEPAPDPELQVPGLDRRWSMTIRRCLEREPERRFRSALDVPPSLMGRSRWPRAPRWKTVVGLGTAALIVAAAAVTYVHSSSPGSRIESMAVLPFVDANTDPDTNYLSEGITESLTNSLSQIPDLRMVARTSAARYKGRDVDPQTVARELGVQAVLTGGVVRRGNRLTIRAELVDARDNSRIWGEQYQRTPSDILLVQQEIARAVSDRLRWRLMGDERRRVTRNYTENVEAYQLYLRGRHQWNKRTTEGLRRAIEYFQQAIERDPNYALAYSGLADSYSNLQGWAGIPTTEALPRARAAALRALELDPSLAEAHASVGLNLYQSWQWAEARREFERAIELNANYASAHQWYSLLLLALGRLDEALVEARRSQQLDPLSPVVNTNAARLHLRRGSIDTAMTGCRAVVELSPDFHEAHICLANIYQVQGRGDDAIAESRKAVEHSGGNGAALSALANAYGVAGRRSEALTILKEVEQRYGTREAKAVWIAWIHVGLGDWEQVFAWLERSFEDRDGTMAHAILLYPFLDPVRSDPRYADLFRRMGLSERQ